jgi:hypothetical protein
MHLKKAAIGLMVILLPLLTLAQHPKQYTVADTISPVLFTHLKQLAGTSTAQLYILSFFSYTCANSVGYLHDNTTLEKGFAHEVAFISITKDDAPSVSAAMHKTNQASLKYSAADTTLSKYFFYESVPHVIWINNNGIIKAITSGDLVTENNIRNILRDEHYSLAVKIDRHYEPRLSLLQNLGLQQHGNYSFFTDSIPGFPGGRSRRQDVAANTTRITAINSSIGGMYALAFKQWLLKPYQVITANDVPSGSYCYELVWNAAKDLTVQTLMLQDLQRRFNTTASMQQKNVTWYELVVDSAKLTPVNTTNALTSIEFIKLLGKYDHLPFIDCELTSLHLIPTTVVTALKANTGNITIPFLNNLLQPYGYSITTKTATKKVLIVQTNPQLSK